MPELERKICRVSRFGSEVVLTVNLCILQVCHREQVLSQNSIKTRLPQNQRISLCWGDLFLREFPSQV